VNECEKHLRPNLIQKNRFGHVYEGDVGPIHDRVKCQVRKEIKETMIEQSQ
jgi:hypothetical protein